MQSQPVAAEQPTGANATVAVRAGAVAPMAPPGAAADVAWEERTVRYTGGPIPPGAQLEERVNGPMVGGGAAAIVVGYALSFYGISARPIAAVTVAGPILAIAGVAAPIDSNGLRVQVTGGNIALWVVSEVLQLGGAALFTAGLFMPKRTLVYDAPANAPRDPNAVPAPGTRRGWYGMRRSQPVRWAVTPGAPDATAGVSLTITNF